MAHMEKIVPYRVQVSAMEASAAVKMESAFHAKRGSMESFVFLVLRTVIMKHVTTPEVPVFFVRMGFLEHIALLPVLKSVMEEHVT